MSRTRADEILVTLPEGTIKQRNPFTGTQVWTVPGRANRPLGQPSQDAKPVRPEDLRAACAFCSDRYPQTPPEKSRLVSDDAGALRELTGLGAADLAATTAEFRRIPNLFEIVPLDYWRANHGFQPAPEVVARCHDYLADPAGLAHLQALASTRARAAGRVDEPAPEEVEQVALAWFASGHELVVPRRHFVDGAVDSSQLASSGTLSVAEHRAYWGYCVAAMADLYSANSAVRQVAVFQNWLKPAGASFDHLHKQLVAIDEYGSQVDQMATLLTDNPRACNEFGLDIALREKLVLAANDHAVAWVGFGHRYPTVEVWSLSPLQPWLQDQAQVDAMSDLVHAMHAAAGESIACNEEWLHRPPGLDERLPWRVLVKWRISTLAGFEGATRIYLNTLSPHAMRDRLLPRLAELRSAGAIAAMQLGDECQIESGTLPTGLDRARPVSASY